MADDYFLDQLTDQVDNKTVFRWFRRGLVLNATKKNEEREFRGRVYPSSLTWSMCPMLFVKNINEPDRFPITAKGEEKKSRGIARHAIIQEALLSTRYYYGDPTYPKFIQDELDRKKQEGRRVRDLPEVYCFDNDWMTSGYLDFPAREKKKLVIVDFKFTNIIPKDWEKHKTERLPGEKYETQLYTYHCHVKKHKYWDQDPSGLRLAVYNNYIIEERDELDPEWEWYSDIDPYKENMTIHLLDETGAHIKNYISNCFKEVCNYKYCPKHKNLTEL